MQKLKVWGGTHPDELPAMVLADPIPNIESGIANQRARGLGRRYVDVNLAGAFPGNPASDKYEQRRAAEICEESRGYDVVVDLHNINYFGENSACIDIDRGIGQEVPRISRRPRYRKPGPY